MLPTLTRRQSSTSASTRGASKPFFLYLPLNVAAYAASCPTQAVAGQERPGNVRRLRDGDGLGARARCWRRWSRTALPTTRWSSSPATTAARPPPASPSWSSKGHFPSDHFRGYKADIWDGGHRIPFLARWPGKVKAGQSRRQLICLTDLMATCAEMLGVKLPDNAGEDSVSILPATAGDGQGPLREAVVHHSINGSVRDPPGQMETGTVSRVAAAGAARNPGSAAEKKLPAVQLYDMRGDVSERQNLYGQQAPIVQQLIALLKKYVADGRSTPGTAKKNDVPVKIWKSKPLSLDDDGKPITHD